jgi:hypothetical protein
MIDLAIADLRRVAVQVDSMAATGRKPCPRVTETSADISGIRSYVLPEALAMGRMSRADTPSALCISAKAPPGRGRRKWAR